MELLHHYFTLFTHWFAIINLTIIAHGIFGAWLISILKSGSITVKIEKNNSFTELIQGFIRGWFFCAYLILQYLYKLGLSKKDRTLFLPAPLSIIGFTIGFFLEIQDLLKEFHFHWQLPWDFRSSFFVFHDTCIELLFAYSCGSCVEEISFIFSR